MFIFSDFTYNKSLCVLLKYKASHIKASKKICPTILKKQNQENALSFATGVRTFRQQTIGKNKSE